MDEAGRAVKAVGVMEDLFNAANSEDDALDPQAADARGADARPDPRPAGNLTRDSLRNLWIEGRDMSGGAGGESCTQLLAREEKKVFSDDDRKALHVLFDRDRMLQALEAGRHWLAAEYRRATAAAASAGFIM